MYVPMHDTRMYPTAYAIVVLPDKRILAVKSARQHPQSSVSAGWECTVTAKLRPEDNPQKVMQELLRSRLSMEVNDLQGQIGNLRRFDMKGRKYVVQSYSVTGSFTAKLSGEWVARAITYKRLLDLLTHHSTRVDFTYDTEYVFRTLFEYNWRPK